MNQLLPHCFRAHNWSLQKQRGCIHAYGQPAISAIWQDHRHCRVSQRQNSISPTRRHRFRPLLHTLGGSNSTHGTILERAMVAFLLVLHQTISQTNPHNVDIHTYCQTMQAQYPHQHQSGVLMGVDEIQLIIKCFLLNHVMNDNSHLAGPVCQWKEAGASNTQGHENYKELNIIRGGNLEYSTCTQV